MHKKDRSPCELTHIFNGVDVLLTPHGFQSMLLLFLPKPAVLFEVCDSVHILIIIAPFIFLWLIYSFYLCSYIIYRYFRIDTSSVDMGHSA